MHGRTQGLDLNNIVRASVSAEAPVHSYIPDPIAAGDTNLLPLS